MESEMVNITKIKDGYFLGDEATAANLDVIFQFKITHMINSAGPQILNAWENIGTKYLTLNWNESPNQNLFDPKDEIANRIVAFIDDSYKNGDGFLVHSVKGQNRACIVVLIYFIKKFRWSLKKSIEFLKSKKNDIDIPSYFLNQLSSFEVRLTKAGIGPKSTSWNDVGTGLMSDIDNEELLIRNTYINCLTNTSIDDLLAYKNGTMKKYTGRKLIWTDQTGRNPLVQQNNKKDLLLQNPKEIKIMQNHRMMKPMKSAIKGSKLNVEQENDSISKSNLYDKQIKNEIDNKIRPSSSHPSIKKNNILENDKEILIEGSFKKENIIKDDSASKFMTYNAYINSNLNNNIINKPLPNHGFLRENSIKKNKNEINVNSTGSSSLLSNTYDKTSINNIKPVNEILGYGKDNNRNITPTRQVELPNKMNSEVKRPSTADQSQKSNKTNNTLILVPQVQNFYVNNVINYYVDPLTKNNTNPNNKEIASNFKSFSKEPQKIEKSSENQRTLTNNFFNNNTNNYLNDKFSTEKLGSSKNLDYLDKSQKINNIGVINSNTKTVVKKPASKSTGKTVSFVIFII